MEQQSTSALLAAALVLPALTASVCMCAKKKKQKKKNVRLDSMSDTVHECLDDRSLATSQSKSEASREQRPISSGFKQQQRANNVPEPLEDSEPMFMTVAEEKPPPNKPSFPSVSSDAFVTPKEASEEPFGPGVLPAGNMPMQGNQPRLRQQQQKQHARLARPKAQPRQFRA